ncbi:SusD/RagB family nutrient-binding outer membrane lipoprotein [Flaviramulus sp. BrNp1-15]|uniref:SusD/RagB family nutrient-binding outer membrane lipoprotein n=1 Tax=Flaviramulus sp. BrNp1-15 TaxID=2916754 RepID=UPI001EE861DA|nr:SusD/RagB family nutrient-binding outer membrane lipoprotein [Flaviramulus sp. BrNp1-15]ULC59640.1 SusD/RagB family nutrient-binding outer membrane lipoprotein [Flaviramulus sp. BrNp1-15]
MKKNIIKTVFITLLIVGLTGCSESYFDVNTPSGTAEPKQLRISDLLAPVIYRTMYGQLYSGEQAFGNYTQYFVGQGGTAVGETTASGLWSSIYLYALPNLKTIKEKADEVGAIHYTAVADILTAINLGIAADTWDNIPYSEASFGQENLFPSFDSQQSIYTEIFSLLDGAISALQTTDNSGIVPGSEDLIYGGDTSKWLRAAYTIKARYQLHLVNKGETSASDVLTTIANGFSSNDDDFQMFFDDKNINPWYSQEILARNTGNFHNDIASQFVSSMNGDYYPFESGSVEIDPRLSIHADNSGEAEWKGFVSGGGGLAPDDTDGNVQFVEGGYYTSIDSPIVLITYAEALFIKAEAAFLANGGTTTSVGSTTEAYTAYMDGIAASMEMFGADGTDYMADTAIDVGEGSLMLHHIMKEKYIHNFLNPETFVDYRRYNFSDEVFTGLTIREEEDSDGDYAGEWFTRASYPSTELNRNSSVVEANQQTPVTPVWWQQ